jgi:hypothetical protein
MTTSNVLLWTALYDNGGVGGIHEAKAIALGSSGSVYVGGVSSDSSGHADFATIKYNPNSGSQLWAARYSGTPNGEDVLEGVVTDGSGNVFVTGTSDGSGTGKDYATIKYNTGGTQLWVARYDAGNSGDDEARGLGIDSLGNVYVTGTSFGGPASEEDYATVKYDSSGSQLWVARYDGPAGKGDYAAAIAVDSAGQVYVTGESTDGTLGYDDFITVKYDTTGAVKWVNRYNGPASKHDVPAAVSLDASGNVYVTGQSIGGGTNDDYATVAYDENGNQLWAIQFNGTGDGQDLPTALAVDSGSNVYVHGNSRGVSGDELVTLKYTQSVASSDLLITNAPMDANVAAGANVSFSVGVSGIGPFAYQWQFNGVDLVDETNASLVLNNIAAAAQGDYRVQVTNLAGTMISAQARLMVDSLPVIVQEPDHWPNLLVTGRARFTVSAIGTRPLSYRWLSNGVAMSGKTGSVLLIPSVKFSDSGDYRVAISNQLGVVTSIVAQLTVIPPVPLSVAWSNPTNITYGTPLSAAQLSATANVLGSFAYTPPLGTVLNAGNNRVLRAVFTPDDTELYPKATNTVTLNVLRAPLTITANDTNKLYGGAVPTFSALYTGFVNGDTPASLNQQVNLTTTATASSPVGTYPIDASGASDPNYTISFVGGTLTVDQAPLTVTAKNASKLYGATLPSFSVMYAGFVNGDNAADLDQPVSITTTATAASPAGSYPITPSGAADANYTISFVDGTLTVNRASLTITARNTNKVYGASLPAFSVTYAGFVNGDNSADLDQPVDITTTATAASPVGSYPITPGGAADANYTISFVNGTLTVTRAPLTITANDTNKLYGAAVPTLTAVYTGFVNGDTPASLNQPLSLTTTATASSPVGSYQIHAGGASDPNYTITFANGTLTVNRAPLTITANDTNKLYGAAVPTLTAVYAGFVNGDTPASLNQPLSLTTTATAGSLVGSYPIAASGASDPNYTISLVNGTLTVNPALLTITARNTNKVYGAALPVFSVAYAGFVNGDNTADLDQPVSISTSATAASPAGSYPITPSGAADANYTISFVNGTLTVNQVPLTITANNTNKVYGAALPAFSVTYAGFVNGDNTADLDQPVNVTTTATAASPVGSYPITPGGAADANYTISFVNATLTVNQAPLTITANNTNKLYGAPVPALSANYSGFVNGDTPASLDQPLNLTTTATAESPLGTYPITADGAADANYTISFVNGTLTVNQAVLTITANSTNKVYGAALPAFSVTYSGFVNGDTPSDLDQPVNITTTATAASPAGSYPITPSGAVDAKYAINFVNGTLTVDRALLTIAANSTNKVYGAALPAFSATYTGFVNGDTPANLDHPVTLTTTATPGSPVGTYPITAAGGAIPTVASYSFDEGSGVVAGDSSGHGLDASLVGNVQWTAGHSGSALDFDGISGYAQVASTSALNFGANKSFTVAAWVRSSSSETSMLLSKQSSFSGAGFSLWNLNTANSRLYARLTDTDGDESGWLVNPNGPYVNDGVWHHVAMVVDRTQQQVLLYTDGVKSPTYDLAAMGANGIGDLSSVSDFVVAGALYEYQGSIDEVRVYGAALTEQELQSLYTGGTPVPSQADSNYAITFVDGILTINPAAATGVLTSSANPALPAKQVTFTLVLSAVSPGAGTPTGPVQFLVDGALGGTGSLSAGSASYNTAVLPVGIHSVVAEYAGDGNFMGVTNILIPSQVINTPPVAGNDTIEREPTSDAMVALSALLANDSDADDDPLMFNVSSNSTAGGTITVEAGNVIYTPPAGYTNSDTFDYVITDGRGGEATATVTVNIKQANEPLQNLVIVPLGDGSYRLSFNGSPEHTYSIEYTEELSPANWQTLMTGEANAFGVFEYVDTPSESSKSRFYRTVHH